MSGYKSSTIQRILIVLVFIILVLMIIFRFLLPADVDVSQYLHEDAALGKSITLSNIDGVTPTMVESDYFSVTANEVIVLAVDQLTARGVSDIRICEVGWIAAPLGGFLVDGKGAYNSGGHTYFTFRIGITDGSEGKAGEEFVFIARGKDDSGNIIWHPEPGPDVIPADEQQSNELYLPYEFLISRERFENLLSRYQ